MDRFFLGQEIGDVSEVTALDELLWSEIQKQSPNRLVLELTPEIPECIANTSSGDMASEAFAGVPIDIL